MKLDSWIAFGHEMLVFFALWSFVHKRNYQQAEHITVIHENMQIAWFSYYTQIISQSFFAIYRIFLFKVSKSEVLKRAVWFVKALLASTF